MVLPKEALKARVAAYKEAMEEAAKVAAEVVAEVVVEAAVNAVVEALPGEPGGSGEPVVIEPDNDESESHDKGAYAVFKEAIEVEDYKASNIEAL
jgi:antirestriction protein